MDWTFGDYCTIEQKRHGGPNEMYLHKVVGADGKSNTYVDVPVRSPALETLHPGELVDVARCVCCGIDERSILKYRTVDLRLREDGNW